MRRAAEHHATFHKFCNGKSTTSDDLIQHGFSNIEPLADASRSRLDTKSRLAREGL